jgi:hypothetical protein
VKDDLGGSLAGKGRRVAPGGENGSDRERSHCGSTSGGGF